MIWEIFWLITIFLSPSLPLQIEHNLQTDRLPRVGQRVALGSLPKKSDRAGIWVSGLKIILP